MADIEIQDLKTADDVVADKNADELQNEVDTQREVRATPSGYGDRMDRDRAEDSANVRDSTLAGLRKVNKGKKASKGPALSGFAKSAAVQAAVGEQFAAQIAGKSEAEVQADGQAVVDKIKENSYSVANKQAVAGAVEPDLNPTLEQVRRIEKAQVEQEEFKQSVGFGDQVAAAFAQTTALPALLKTMHQPEYESDPTYNYSARRDEIEQGLSEADRQYMRQSRSLQEEQARMSVVKQNMEDNRKIGVHGTTWAVASSLTAGFLDPVGWGVGLGVGKAAQVAGLSTQAALKAGQLGKAVGLGALEGTAANVGITAVIDAAGGHVSDKDYAYAAGFGMVFGAGGAALGLRAAASNAAEGRIRAATDDVLATRDAMLQDGHVQMMQARERAQAKAVDVPPTESVVDQVQAEVTARAAEPTPVFETNYKASRRPAGKGETTSAATLLEGLTTHADPMVGVLAGRMRTLMGDDIPVVHYSGLKRSHYDVGSGEVRLGPDATPEIQLHEITHALTADRVRYGIKNPDTAIGGLTKELHALLDVAQTAAKGQKLDKTSSYFLTNIDEFMAGLYSGAPAKKFHDFLASIPVDAQGTTMLNYLVKTVRRILGMKESEHNGLTKAMGLTDELVQQPLIVRNKQYKVNKDGLQKLVSDYQRNLSASAAKSGERIQANANLESYKMYDAVALRTGPEPSPEAVQRELDNIMRERYADAMNIVHARVRNDKRFLPEADASMVKEDGSVVTPTELLLPKAEREAVGNSWGIDDQLVESSVDRAMLSEMAARSERWAAENPTDAARVDSILAKMPFLASTGLQLAKSEHPTARMIAGLLLENTTGAVGRGRTAALDKNMLQRQYDEYLARAEDHYTSWRNRNNGNLFTDTMSGELRDRFQREVSQEIRSREDGAAPRESDPDVRAYVDQLEAGYDRMRVDQQRRNTVGAARLGDSSRGYSPRSISAKWARSATPEQRRALSKEFSDQLEEQWGDRAFADKIATSYVERARLEAGGGVPVPSNLYSDEANEILRDVMRAAGVSDEEVSKLLGKFSRGGASHTKKRLELDLDAVVRTENGDEFRVADAFEHDQAKLYQNYARRTSGEVALTNFGVYGQRGLQQLRRLMADFGPTGKPATIEEIRAFDQIAAEFYGVPLAGTNNKALGNLRLVGSMSMLGGMSFNQLAEFSNAIPLLGLGGALKQVSMLPRLIGDVVKGRKSPILDSIELVGGPIGHDQRVVFPYQDLDDTQVWGAADLNAFDRILRAGAQALPWLNGFHYVHSAQVRGIAEQIVHKSMKYIRTGDENAALASMGMNAQLRTRMARDLDNIATFDAQGNLVALDLTKATDPEAMSEFVQTVHRGSKQIIQGTYIGETGKWAHDDLLRILTQFRTFSITSMEKQWTRQRADQGTIKAMGLLLGTMSLALPIHLARVNLNAQGREDKDEYLERQLQPAMLARNLLNYSSISGGLGDIIDAGAALTGTQVSGGRTGAQTAATDAIPAISYVNGLVGAIKERDPRELLRALPYGNLPYLVPLMNFTDE